MTASAKAKEKWAHQRFQRAAEQCRAAMEPHLEKMETDNGILAMLLVSGIAQLVALGHESPAALAYTVKQASILSGIPEAALDAQARFSSEMLTCFEFDQQNKSPR